ncbi:MAG: hypothetical protein QOE41_2800 [Mycobacterium sp.]|jgi:hypothetical protein|nr:hypothetical protein [Mycobacterium sp.]
MSLSQRGCAVGQLVAAGLFGLRLGWAAPQHVSVRLGDYGAKGAQTPMWCGGLG